MADVFGGYKDMKRDEHGSTGLQSQNMETGTRNQCELKINTGSIAKEEVGSHIALRFVYILSNMVQKSSLPTAH